MQKTNSMKKILFLTLTLAIGITSFANNRVLTDYVDNEKIFDILKDDTITIKAYASENRFKFVEPDTIWWKRVKRPKENKHYQLQWFDTLGIHNVLADNSVIYKDFVYRGYQYNNDTLELLLYDIDLQRTVTCTPKPYERIKCSQMERRIYEYLQDSIFYYKDKNMSEDDFFESTKVVSCEYIIKLHAKNPTTQITNNSIDCQLLFQNNLNGYLKANDITLLNSQKVFITKEEFLTHNQYVATMLKNDSAVRLARVFDHEAIHARSEYGFEGDTMAIIHYYKKAENRWSDSIEYFIAYAYGKEYTITINSYEKIQDKIVFIDSTDLNFLKERKGKGFLTRQRIAKEWDIKNKHIIRNDLILDTTHVVMGTYIFSDWPIQNIEMDGEFSSKDAIPPTDGTLIPIFKYGSGGDLRCAWWGTYNGNIFAIDWRDVRFENDNDRLYLMRRGGENLEERYTNAFARDFADRFIELIEKEEKQKQKVENLIRKKIFLLSMDKAYGDYDWCGIKPKFLNSYNKTIKYIDCLVVPYNTFNDVQSDDYGRSSKEIRCIGPFEPGEIASWRFDDMFKNESGIIKSFRITNIKITFTDNSTILYKGWENVKKHYEYVYDL